MGDDCFLSVSMSIVEATMDGEGTAPPKEMTEAAEVAAAEAGVMETSGANEAPL